ncbi:hypothetical protein EYF80_015988 [Liparis tanakae]|uniref:Uncharacterized protein n=1 Tax=Liparis tanakae TaxID=230148 RepID=A0A4Z2I7G9_9TELE|nr:hypothetical protein EYF80_015988 [Liparis tanakae]
MAKGAAANHRALVSLAANPLEHIAGVGVPGRRTGACLDPTGLLFYLDLGLCPSLLGAMVLLKVKPIDEPVFSSRYKKLPSVGQSQKGLVGLPVNSTEGADGVPCCEPTSQETVPVLYVDEFSTVVISSVQLTRGCGCDPGGDLQSKRHAPVVIEKLGSSADVSMCAWWPLNAGASLYS